MAQSNNRSIGNSVITHDLGVKSHIVLIRQDFSSCSLVDGGSLIGDRFQAIFGAQLMLKTILSSRRSIHHHE